MKRIYTNEERIIRARISRKKWKINNKEYFKTHKKEISNQMKQWKEKRAKSWIGFIAQEVQCEICGKKIYYNNKNRLSAIHFDHKTGNEIIKVKPTSWLIYSKRIPENEKIWKSCNFGMLCYKCNIILPTKNRKEFVKKIIKYIWGEQIFPV